MSRRECTGRTANGLPCRQAPIVDGEFCFWHDPEHAEEARQARQLGGKRARKEATIQGAYNLGDLATPEGIRRVLDIMLSDALQIDDFVQRVRVTNQIVRNATLLLDTTDANERLRLVKETDARGRKYRK